MASDLSDESGLNGAPAGLMCLECVCRHALVTFRGPVTFRASASGQKEKVAVVMGLVIQIAVVIGLVIQIAMAQAFIKQMLASHMHAAMHCTQIILNWHCYALRILRSYVTLYLLVAVAEMIGDSIREILHASHSCNKTQQVNRRFWTYQRVYVSRSVKKAL